MESIPAIKPLLFAHNFSHSAIMESREKSFKLYKSCSITCLFPPLFHRDELHLCVCWPLSPGLLLPFQLGNALPAEPLGVALSKPVGDCTVAAHRLPALQEEILPQNISRIIHPTSLDCIILYFHLKAASKANFKLFFLIFLC